MSPWINNLLCRPSAFGVFFFFFFWGPDPGPRWENDRHVTSEHVTTTPLFLNSAGNIKQICAYLAFHDFWSEGQMLADRVECLSKCFLSPAPNFFCRPETKNRIWNWSNFHSPGIDPLKSNVLPNMVTQQTIVVCWGGGGGIWPCANWEGGQ